MKKAIAFLFCLCLFAAALPVCAEQSSFPEYTYDNSFLLTVESSENKVYTADDFPDIYNVISLKTVSKIQKEDGSFEYVLMFVIDDFNMDEQKAIFEKYGDKASKNYYAEDYAQKSSYITLSDNEIYLPVGEKGKVEVTDFFIDKNETETLGIDFSFDFGVYPYHELTLDTFKNYGIGPFYAGEPQYDESITSYGPCHGFTSGVFFNEPCAVGEVDYKVDIIDAADRLSKAEGIYSVQPFFRNDRIEKDAPLSSSNTEWCFGDGSENGDYIELSDNVVSGKDTFAEFSGVKPGTSVLKLESKYRENVTEGSCTVHVYLGGDVNQNGKVTVTDALLALQNTVGKIELSKVQTLSGDMNGDGKISVDDALVILQMSVGK